MKKILFIMLEIESASGTCTLNVAEELSKNGCSVDILCYDSSRGMSGSSNLNFHHISPRFSYYLKQKLGSNSPISRTAALAYAVKLHLLSFMWPFNAPFFCLRLLKKAEALHKKNHYDCIIPVYTQLDPLIAASLLKKKYNDFKMIAYFLDSLSAGPRLRLLSENMQRRLGLWWEKTLLRNADKVIFMESSRKHHEKFSKDQPFWSRCVFMDVPSFVVDSGKTGKVKKNSTDSISLAYVGTLPLSIRNPLPGLQMLSKIKINKKIIIYMVGPIPESKNFIEQCDKLNMEIRWVGALTHDEAKEYILKADVLLNFGNNISGMVPSKVFEYMSYLKPILAFSPSEADPSIPYLDKYPMSCIIREENNQDDNILKIEKFLNTSNKSPLTGQELKSLFYTNTPEYFADAVLDLLH